MKPDPAAEWPQWRGPRRDGIARSARLPARWPATLPAPAWRTPVGIGYSSPAVAGGQVYVMGRDEAGNERGYALDAASGRVRWQFAYPSAFAPPDPTAGKGPNATPTVDKDRVYFLGLGGMFHCYAARTGRLLWKRDFAAEYWGVEKDEMGDKWFPVCGASASPLVEGSQVIVSVGGKKAGSLAAFDRGTGRLLWKALDDRSSYASPLIEEVGGIRQVVAFTGQRMVGLEARTRTLLWEHPFRAMYEQTIVTPVVWKNRILVAGEARPTVALEFERQGAVLTPRIAWQSAELGAYLTTPTVFHDHAVGLDHRSRRLVCLDLTNGKTAWTSPRLARLFVSLVAAGERLLALSDSGELHILEADPAAYRPVQTYKVAEPGAVWSQLAVVENRLYIRDQTELRCYAF